MAFSSLDLNGGRVVPDLGVSRATPNSTIHIGHGGWGKR
jgi:hypothetical protein